jgi:hypothetical protein
MSTFFTSFNKRPRNNTITDFKEDEAIQKIITFMLENNLSFNVITSDSFLNLLSYYNQ